MKEKERISLKEIRINMRYKKGLGIARRYLAWGRTLRDKKIRRKIISTRIIKFD